MIYLIKANLILALLCLLFQVLMYRDTFFGVRRMMLWGIYLTTYLLPLWDVQEWLDADMATHDVAEAYAVYVLPTLHVTAERVAGMGITQSEPGYGMWFAGMMTFWVLIYLIPALWLTAKLIGQVAYIIYLRCTCRPIRVKSKKYRLHTDQQGNIDFSLGGEADHSSFFTPKVFLLPRPCSPFSFGSWIFIHTDGLDEQTLHEVLIHEQAHVQGWHTLDILFSQLVCILFWWNPAAWVMRREVRLNLEFLADSAVIGCQTDKREYQYRLLSFTTQKNVATIANNFNVLPLKRRITMMNLRKTPRTGMLKYILFVPVAAALLFASNIDALARTLEEKVKSPLISSNLSPMDEPQTETEADTCLTPIDPGTLFIVDGKQMTVDEFKSFPNLRADNIESATMIGSESAIQIYGDKGAKGAVIIETKKSTPDDKIYDVVEVLPKYPGDESALYQYLQTNIKYPAVALEYGVQGRVMVTFVVEKDGTLSEVEAKTARDLKTGKELAEVVVTYKRRDMTEEEVAKAEQQKRQAEGVKAIKAESERIVKAIPERWKPGQQGGKPVRTRFTLPLVFRLQ